MMITRSITMKENDSTTQKHKHINSMQLNLSRSYVRKPKPTKEPEATIYSLKPQKYSIPKDVSVIEIMQTMKSSNTLRIKTTFLKITPTEKNQRRTYIEKLKLFIVCEKFPYALVSYSIYLMDLLIAQKPPIPIEHMFIGSMLLGIKYYSIDPRILFSRRVMKFMKESCGAMYTIEELNQIEIRCLMYLDYKLNWVHASHFIQLLLLNGILFNIDTSTKTDAANANIYDLIYNIMDTLYEGEKYFSQDAFHLACACVAVAREICGFSPWSSVLEKVFSINFSQFGYCFDFVKESYLIGQKEREKQKIIQTPQKQQHYEKKAIQTTIKPRQEQLDMSSANSIMKTECKEMKHKGLTAYKSKSLEIDKDQVEGFIYTQRTLCYKPKQLTVIKENDINSTKDNSFGIVTEMNQNKSSYYNINNNKEINAYNNANHHHHGRPGVISMNNSCNDIVKRLNFNQAEDNNHPKYTKIQIKQSDNNIGLTTRREGTSIETREEEEAEQPPQETSRKPNQISMIKHMHNKSVINIHEKSYLIGIKRLLRENKNTKLFDNFEAVKKNDQTFYVSSHHKK